MKITGNFKSLFFALIAVVTISGSLIAISCSREGNEEKANSALREGNSDYEVGINNNGKYEITASMEEIREAFQNHLKDINIDAVLNDYEIASTPVEGTEDEVAYLLYGYTNDYFVKVAIVLNYSAETHRFYIESSLSETFMQEDATITCTSTECGRGKCVPTVALLNGKKVPDCSTCTKTCTKTATASW